MKQRGTVMLTAALCLVCAAAGISAAAAGELKACTKTAWAARRACSHEVRDDFWVAAGSCLNIARDEEREECLFESALAKREALAECGEQFAARLEVCDELGEQPYDPQIDPADFLDAAGIAADPNPYFPLVPGTVWVYEGGGETITVTVTGETKEILGVECVVVTDVVEEGGEVVEDTDDWYGQDVFGNVWYFGEIARNFEDGELVDLEGSWKAGRDGARPGILMPATPMAGDVYRQEFLLGDAEDVAEVLSLTGSAVVPAASCDGDCLVTLDSTPLEPEVAEHKYYAPGVGLILEADPDTGDLLELVGITAP